MRTQLLLETWQREELHDDDSNLDLSLGMSFHRSETKQEDDINGGFNLKLFAAGLKEKTLLSSGAVVVGARSWVSFGGAAGFAHPWSLAARQKKAAFEQRQLNNTVLPPPPPPPPPLPQSQTMSGPQPTPVVGWPPVRACRMNMVSPRLSKPNMEVDEKEAKRPKKSSELETQDKGKAKKISFVKVNMEGLAVGRKIDLTAHNDYQSLSHALRKLFDNLIFVKDSGKECDENGDAKVSDLVILYEDNEGDRMLVGDVPWEMFVGSVKRLYITYRSRTHSHVDGEEKKDIIDQGTNNVNQD